MVRPFVHFSDSTLELAECTPEFLRINFLFRTGEESIGVHSNIFRSEPLVVPTAGGFS